MTVKKARYYEDVELGEEIGPLEKTVNPDAVAAFCRVWGVPIPNRFTDVEIAKQVRLPGSIVPGNMTLAMMAQFLMDWSPNVELKLLDVVYRQPVPHGRVLITGLVTDKRYENGENLVECDMRMSNEEQGNMIGGRAVVTLPSRRA